MRTSCYLPHSSCQNGRIWSCRNLLPGNPAIYSAKMAGFESGRSPKHESCHAARHGVAIRLHEALWRLNPVIPEEAREDALRKVLRIASPSLVQTNRAFHRMLRGYVADRL